MANLIQFRRGSAANWSSVNPILAQGEVGVETDELGTEDVKEKIGDGVTAWNSLPYRPTGSSETTETIKQKRPIKTINNESLEGVGNIEISAGGVSNVYETNTITFINTAGDYFGRYATPRTGEMLVDETGAVTGGISVVYYINSTLDIPFTPIATVGDFINNQLCKLYIERDVNNNYTLNIVNL